MYTVQWQDPLIHDVDGQFFNFLHATKVRFYKFCPLLNSSQKYMARFHVADVVLVRVCVCDVHPVPLPGQMVLRKATQCSSRAATHYRLQRPVTQAIKPH